MDQHRVVVIGTEQEVATTTATQAVHEHASPRGSEDDSLQTIMCACKLLPFLPFVVVRKFMVYVCCSLWALIQQHIYLPSPPGVGDKTRQAKQCGKGVGPPWALHTPSPKDYTHIYIVYTYERLTQRCEPLLLYNAPAQNVDRLTEKNCIVLISQCDAGLVLPVARQIRSYAADAVDSETPR